MVLTTLQILIIHSVTETVALTSGEKNETLFLSEMQKENEA